MDVHATTVAENLSNKYGQKLVDTDKKSATDAFKIASKRAIQKAAEATGDLVGNTIANKITSISKKKKQQVSHTQTQLAMKYQKKNIYLYKTDKKLLMD